MPKKLGEVEAAEYEAAPPPAGFYAPRVRFADTLDRAVETK